MQLSPTTPADRTTRAAYLLLMFGGTLHMLIAVRAGMPGPLTCAAALWAVAGLYASGELLNRRPAAAPPEAIPG